jgi:putative ABC transport system substrate-binding protein
MNRRAMIRALLVLIAATWALAAAAQHYAPAHRIGVLAQDLQPGLLDTFRSKLGYVAGRDISIEVRDAVGKSKQLPMLANDLLRLKVDVILAVNTPAAKTAKEATKSIPIVILRVADPVKSGLLPSS